MVYKYQLYCLDPWQWLHQLEQLRQQEKLSYESGLKLHFGDYQSKQKDKRSSLSQIPSFACINYDDTLLFVQQQKYREYRLPDLAFYVRSFYELRVQFLFLRDH